MVRGRMAKTEGRKEVNVVVLGRDNYGRWRIEVETALRGLGLYWIASGTDPRIEEPAALGAAATNAEKGGSCSSGQVVSGVGREGFESANGHHAHIGRHDV